MLEAPLFMKMGYDGEEVYDEELDTEIMTLKEDAPEEAKKSYITYLAFVHGDINIYDDWDLYTRVMERKAKRLFGDSSSEDEELDKELSIIY